MGLEEFEDLPSRLEDWTYETVKYLVKKYEFEPGTFDYKDVLNPTGPNQNYNGTKNLDKARSVIKVEASKHGTATETLLTHV